MIASNELIEKGSHSKVLLKAIIDTTFDAVSTKPKIHVLLSSKAFIILEK